MHFKNARNASVYAVFRAFFTQSLAKLRIIVRFRLNCNRKLKNALPGAKSRRQNHGKGIYLQRIPQFHYRVS